MLKKLVILGQMLKLFKRLLLLALLLVLPCMSRAQNLLTTEYVSVDNGDPQRVLLHFATGSSQNIMLVVLSCSTASVNRNRVFVYEFAPNGQINSYETTTTVTCNIHFSDPNHVDDIFTAQLVDAITITNVPDHPNLVIEPYVAATETAPASGTFWAANLGTGPRGGHFWQAIQSLSQGQIDPFLTGGGTGGGGNDTPSVAKLYRCGSEGYDCLNPPKPGSCWWDGKGADWLNIHCMKAADYWTAEALLTMDEVHARVHQ